MEQRFNRQQQKQRDDKQFQQDQKNIVEGLRQQKLLDRARLEDEISEAETAEQQPGISAGSLQYEQERVSDAQFKVSQIDKGLAGH